MGFQIERIVLRQIRMPLLHFFETSFGRTYERHIVLIEVISEGLSGWGEITAGENPFYNEEWTESAWLIARDFAAPRVLKHTFDSASQVAARTSHIRGHRIACGVSIGIQDSVPQLIKKIETEVNAGYQRIKMKIKPGWDIDVIREVRKNFPNIRLMADANSAYTLNDIDRLKCLDEFNLMMIEQPLAHDEIIDHVQLQAALKTPICLDECIRSGHQAEQAIRMKACGIINIKLGRVGGFREAKRVHDVAQRHGIPVWCGGMLESGIGRAHNIALSTLPNFVLPGDVSASKRYWARDIITPSVEVSPRGTITVPQGPGFGYDLDLDYLKSLVVREEVLS